uniref:Bax inhibitor 1 n=1 Tax=Lygus hesperus TaxID=30085 RepID=A0A0A9W5Y1_LYGHE
MYTHRQPYNTIPNLGDIFSNFTSKPILPHVQQYMMKVYGTVAFTLVAAFVGCLVDIEYQLCGVMTTVLEFVAIFYLLLSRHTIDTITTRFAVLLGVGFLSGVSLGTLVEFTLQLDPSIVATSTMMTALIFAAISFIALRSPTTYWLFLQSIITMTALGLLVFSIMPFFFPSMYYIVNVISFIMVRRPPLCYILLSYAAQTSHLLVHARPSTVLHVCTVPHKPSDVPC